jgi:ATP-dependent exoDNAse (exonuclease V) alpha subunit
MSMITVDLNEDIFSFGQAYTAISRACKLEDVHIASLDWSAFRADPAAIKEYERLQAIAVAFPELNTRRPFKRRLICTIDNY